MKEKMYTMKRITKKNKTKTKKIIFSHIRDDKIKLIEANKEKIEFEYQLASDGDVVEI